MNYKPGLTFACGLGCFAVAFADVGEGHADDEDDHGDYLDSFQVVKAHHDGGDCGKYGEQILVEQYPLRADQFLGGLHEEIGQEGRAQEDEKYLKPGSEQCGAGNRL